MSRSRDRSVSHPLITIAITCYNAKDTIQRAVVSAIRQTWPNREILILDDHSMDGSWDVIQNLIQEFPALRAIRHRHNRGYPAACNALLAEARGEFVALFDDDDESAANRLEAQYERITTYEAMHENSFVFCYSNQRVVPPGETEPEFQTFAIGRLPPEPYGAIVADHRLGLITSGPYSWGDSSNCTLMARTTSLRIVGGFDERLRRGQDADLVIRAALKGAHFISVNAPLITRYLTDTPDKASAIELKYRLLRLRKHKAYLVSKRAYLGAVVNVFASVYHWKGCHLRGHIIRTVALALFPWHISRERLMSWRYRAAIRADEQSCQGLK